MSCEYCADYHGELWTYRDVDPNFMHYRSNFCPMCGAPLTPPQPLTLEELRGMDGKPVYAACIKSDALSCWGYVTDGCVVGYHANFGFSEYSKTWLAYPTEPGRED